MGAVVRIPVYERPPEGKEKSATWVRVWKHELAILDLLRPWQERIYTRLKDRLDRWDPAPVFTWRELGKIARAHPTNVRNTMHALKRQGLCSVAVYKDPDHGGRAGVRITFGGPACALPPPRTGYADPPRTGYADPPRTGYAEGSDRRRPPPLRVESRNSQERAKPLSLATTASRSGPKASLQQASHPPTSRPLEELGREGGNSSATIEMGDVLELLVRFPRTPTRGPKLATWFARLEPVFDVLAVTLEEARAYFAEMLKLDELVGDQRGGAPNWKHPAAGACMPDRFERWIEKRRRARSKAAPKPSPQTPVATVVPRELSALAGQAMASLDARNPVSRPARRVSRP